MAKTALTTLMLFLETTMVLWYVADSLCAFPRLITQNIKKVCT